MNVSHQLEQHLQNVIDRKRFEHACNNYHLQFFKQTLFLIDGLSEHYRGRHNVEKMRRKAYMKRNNPVDWESFFNREEFHFLGQSQNRTRRVSSEVFQETGC